ncbi:MAG: DUF934 domain-containing protein [Granulosicoccus sp.]|nr:DUF934 domain-containing protein [Granulosicoccus sp.]
MTDDARYLFIRSDSVTLHGALDDNSFVLDGSTDPASLQEFPDSSIIVIEFDDSSDGRGFSLAKHLRNRLNFHGQLYATGGLIPDQVAFSFSCGIDAVLVSPEKQSQYGLQTWLTSGARQSTHYWARGVVGGRQAWTERVR